MVLSNYGFCKNKQIFCLYGESLLNKDPKDDADISKMKLPA